jgi:hypothetical protein
MAAVTGALAHKKALSAGNLVPVLPQHFKLPGIKDESRSFGLCLLCSPSTFFEFCNSFFARNVDSSCKFCLLVSPTKNFTDLNLDVYEATISAHSLHTRLRLEGHAMELHELHGDFWNSNICYSGCLHSCVNCKLNRASSKEITSFGSRNLLVTDF